MSHDSIDTEIDLVHRQLSSSKITQRKEGLKKLNVLLDSNEFLQALDDNTLATPAAGKIKVGTWPGLCVTLVEYAAIEVTASVGKKKGPDAAIPKALRRFVQLADDDRRTELLDLYMGKLEEQLDRTEDTFRHMSSLLLLLQQFPGDMEPLFQQDVVTFFSNQLPVINQLREDSRISTAFTTALNSFLFKNGLDVSSRSGELQQALQPFLLRAWRSSRDQKLKDAFITCLSIQVRLGGLQIGDGPQSLSLHRRYKHTVQPAILRCCHCFDVTVCMRQEVKGAAAETEGLLNKEIGASSFRWGSEDRHGIIKISRQADSFLQLAAAVHHLNAMSGSTGAMRPNRSDPPQKKLKVTPPLVCLHEQATDAPVQWAPVLSMLIHNHCHHIPHSAFTHWLQALHSHRFEDAPEPAATLWLLRYVYQLALAWPAALTAAEDSSDAAGDDTSIRLLESHWKAVWDNLMTWLSTTTSKPAVQECGIALLAVIADRGLAPNLQLRLPQLWSLPVLQQGPLAAPSAHLVRAAFSQGAAASDQEKALQQSLLKRVLTDATAEAPPQLLVHTAAVLIYAAVSDHSQYTSSPAGWMQDWDDDFQQQLGNLARGEEWMARNAQQARDAYQKAAAAKRAAATSPEAASSESAGSRQKLTGQLLQQQLQLLTVDLQEADSPLLTKLLRMCLVTVGLMPALKDAAGAGVDTAEDLVTGAATHLSLSQHRRE
ncbi:hypothetical protein ABBQ32_001121 [Trebouxia sp. C0010 RCD-2024]